MEITQTNKTITISSTTGNYVYAIERNTLTSSTIVYSATSSGVTQYTFTEDGYYTIISVVLPTSNMGSYYAINGKIYNSSDEEITVQTLLADESVTRNSTNYFTYAFLKDTFVSLENDYISKIVGKSIVTTVNQQIRDTIFMGFTVMDILVEKNTSSYYLEAERILQQLITCTSSTTTCSCYA